MKTWRVNNATTGLRKWQAGLAEAFVRLDAESVGSSDFSRGYIDQARLHNGFISRVKASQHRIVRRQEHVATRRRDVVFANLQLSGRASVQMPGLSCETAPMDLCLVPTADTYSITHAAPFELLSIALPQSAVPANLGPGILRLSHSATGRELAGVLAGLGALALRLPDAADALHHQILSTLSLAKSSTSDDTSDDALRQAILAHIQRKHTETGLSAAPLAAAFGLTERRLHALFQDTGQPIGARIEALRLETAKTLLETSTLPISSVARRAGFGDPSYFARVFRRNAGMSPRDWRAAQSC